jgi:hypothetical protein
LRNTWLPYRAAKENCFLWQILYRVPATQKWRFLELSRIDRATHCTRCNRGHQEDIIHCIWNCSQSLIVWDWIRRILEIASPVSGANLELTALHVLTAEDLPPDLHIPFKLWAVLRAVACWEIWKARCSHFMNSISTTPAHIIRTIWYRLLLYLKLFWRNKCTRIRTGRLELDKAKSDMHREFGRSIDIWYLTELHLTVPSVPPSSQELIV